MKKFIGSLILLTMTISVLGCTGGSSPTSMDVATIAPDKKVVVYYFHFTRRCMTCNNVEKVSKDAVESLFSARVKSGEVSFLSVNLDEKEGEAIGAKLKIDGQSLIVISGDKRVDLTEKGFLYANDKPEKLKAEIKKAVEGMGK